MNCTHACNQGRDCTCRTPAPYVHESEFAPLYRYFRDTCHMGRWKAFWKALDCWSVF